MEVIRGWTSRKHKEYRQSISARKSREITQLEKKSTKNNDRAANRELSFKRTSI